MTLTNKQIEAMTEEQRRAWLDGWSADEAAVGYLPDGYRFNILMAAYVKYALVTTPMPVGERLQFLEGLDRLTDKTFTAEVLAAVKPASTTAVKMMNEALNNDPDRRRISDKTFRLLTSWEVIWRFIGLDPSLLDAIKLCGHHSRRATKSAPA
jgi:hypothetical protein